DARGGLARPREPGRVRAVPAAAHAFRAHLACAGAPLHHRAEPPRAGAPRARRRLRRRRGVRARQARLRRLRRALSHLCAGVRSLRDPLHLPPVGVRLLADRAGGRRAHGAARRAALRIAGTEPRAMTTTPSIHTTPSIAREERLIVALDVPSAAEARALVERIGDAACFYKIGLELFSAEGYFELARWLAGRGCKVFADLKLYDIPETVRR